MSIRLCIEDKKDPAYPVLEKLVADFPDYDARIMVETEDPALHGSEGRIDNLGPNPKIRNISRAYREAKGDVIWVIDCNVWVARGVMGRMVDKLMGYAAANKSAQPYKFVHQLPLVVDIVDYWRPISTDSQTLLASTAEASTDTDFATDTITSTPTQVLSNGGGRLDEMFMATTHVKFYGAINIVGIAPCIVGKSNMFRKSHLDMVTDPVRNPALPKNDVRPSGVDYFSHNICEDHLIGDLLWRTKIPSFANHGIVWGDLVLQPMAGMSIASYAGRRVRWLRARKFTVLAATLVEPGIESLLCSAYFAFGVTTLPWFHETFSISHTWVSMLWVWFACLVAWMSVDWVVFQLLHNGATIEVDADTPAFARGNLNPGGKPKRWFVEWLAAWIGREVMALPIWTWAVLLGTTVNWRGKTFYVRLDTSVEELPNSSMSRKIQQTPELERARQPSKDRLD